MKANNTNDKFATSSGHWYASDGEPAYTQPNKSKPGEFRNTTIRDAKKLNLYPSVTGILNMADKPALNKWKMDQLMMAALTLPAVAGETLKEYENRLWEDANKQSKDARDEGTRIHGIIESYFESNDNADNVYVEAVLNALNEAFGSQQWHTEKSFSCPAGYGGKVDLHSGMVVVDFKTKDFTEEQMKKPFSYPEQIMQLSAYKNGLELPEDAQIANLFISRTAPGLVKLEIHEEDMYDRFACLLKYWQLVKGYSPNSEQG